MDQRNQEIVFYSGWFNRNQEKLLKFANSWIGRRILCINGKRSDVGRNKIFKIEPHAIHWKNSDGTCSVEYRSHAKFAKRLYHFFRPVWETMHFFDMQFANRFAPQLNLGFDTLTVYPDANPESTTVDGGTWLFDSGTDRSWATLIATGANNVSDTSATMSFGQFVGSTTTNTWWGMYRSFFLFNTSSLGALAVISSATVSVFGSAKQNTSPADANFNVYSSNPASNTSLSTSDHGSLGTTAFSSNISYSAWSTSGYNSFTLNGSGLAAISKTGITKFGGRSTADAANSMPAWSAFCNQHVQFYTADQGGTGNDPRLVVNYSVQATVTNSVNFTIGNAIPLTISNPSSLYVRAFVYVNGSQIFSRDLGQVTSATITPTSPEIADMYAACPNTSSPSVQITLQSFSDSGYSSQVGSNQDKAGTGTVDPSNAPTFTTFTLANIDKTVDNIDKYGTTLISSSTQTLLGSSTDRFIKGYSQVRAAVSSANKMVPLNSATGNKYRFTNGAQFDEEPYHASNTVNLDIDNVTVNTFAVIAFDSRGLTTQANNTMGLMADYAIPTLSNLEANRDNNVDPTIVLSFNGTFWKKYFSSNTTSNPGNGVLNDVVIKYRYKETTQAWGAQTWTTITGDASIDSSGNITFSDPVNGDLGAGGFTVSKSFNIEVVIYDKLANVIVEVVLDKGIPIMDWTQEGVAVKALYDTTEGGSFQVDGHSLENLLSRANSNLLINSNMNIAERRTSFTYAGGGGFGPVRVLDRWGLYHDNGGSGSLPQIITSQETFTPGELQGAKHFLRVAVNGAGSGMGASQQGLIAYQTIKNGTRLYAGAGQKLKVKLKARSSISNKKIGISVVQYYGSGGSPTSQEVIQGTSFTLTSNLAEYEHTFDLNTLSGKTFGTDGLDWIVVFVWGAWGSSQGTTHGLGSAETYRGSGNIDLAQIEAKTIDFDIPFLPKSREQDYWECLPFCYVLFNTNNQSYTGYWGAAATTTDLNLIVTFPRPLITFPSFSATASEWQSYNAADGPQTGNTIVINGNGNAPCYATEISLRFSSAVLTVHRPYFLLNNGANRKMIFDCELG